MRKIESPKLGIILCNGSLVEVKTKETIPSRYIGIAYSNACIPSFSTRKLIDILKKTIN